MFYQHRAAKFLSGLILMVAGMCIPSASQDLKSLTLQEAVDASVANYPSIRAKQNYLRASDALTRNARNEYLPNVIASLQQNYGTINSQFGPAGAIGTLGVASAGPVYTQQSWNAAFGALYIISTNWEVFTFGRIHSRVVLGSAQQKRDAADLEQEMFVQRIKVSAAYLNLLIAQQLVESGKSNLERVQAIERTVKSRTRSGLNPGVDSSFVNAEVSKARLSIIEYITNEQNLQRQLSELMGIDSAISFLPDTTFFSRIPPLTPDTTDIRHNPQLKFYRARVDYASALSDVIRKSVRPGIILFGVYQGRASGFSNDYNPGTLDGYSDKYTDGIRPSRYNYVTGVSFTWNLMSPLKIHQQVKAQRFIEAGVEQEYEQVDNQLNNQLILAGQRLANTIQSAQEVPLQFSAASEAYHQKSVLYKNGLTTIVDLQQALFVLNRAEIDQRVAYVNVWHALLLKAAAAGDFNLFINQVQY